MAVKRTAAKDAVASREHSEPRGMGMGGSTPPVDVETYLAQLSETDRAALEDLRAKIRAAAPAATEVISYRMPTFKHHGGLVAMAAFADHCSFFTMSPEVMESHREDLVGYDTSKGTIRFKPDQPLPAELVEKLVRARVAENERRKKRA
jgi:uncharacterized protein YdhG (YjbR/CyaY superfamily)